MQPYAVAGSEGLQGLLEPSSRPKLFDFHE